MVQNYTSNDIKVLDEITHVRTNSSMYIGSTENPIHLVDECIDNALDECIAGFASIVAVNINTENYVYSVLDNGRGLPISNDTPTIVSTKLFSGAKFHGKKTAYKISSGLHGVGLICVNALSDWYTIEIYRNNKHAIFKFIDAKLKSKKIEEFKDTVPFSTKIEFKPNKKIFEKLIPDINHIRKRLTTASAELPGEKVFVLNIDNNREIFNLSLEDHFKKQCINSDRIGNIINLQSFKPPELFNILMTYSTNGSITPKVMSSINLLPVDSGGTHVNSFYDLIKDFYSKKAKKYGYKFQINDSLCGLRCYLILNLIEPKFSSQTKEKLTNRKSYFEFFIKQLGNQLENYYSKNENELKLQLEAFDIYRKKLDSKKVKVNSTGKRASTKFTKLRDCTSRNGILFIVEGDSAGGSIVQCRNPKIHAIFPLKGKIPNVSTMKDILKNKEVSELIKALGTGVGPEFDITKLRYSKIIAAADSDIDGYHIASLITMVLAILTPEIIKNGHYYIAQTPLHAINEKKDFIPLWNKKDLDQAIKNNRRISRFKGLGEFTPNQMKICLLDDSTKSYLPISFSNNIKDLIKLFSDSSEKRKLLNSKD